MKEAIIDWCKERCVLVLILMIIFFATVLFALTKYLPVYAEEVSAPTAQGK